VLLAVKVSRLGLAGLAPAELNVAVTPVGTLVTPRFTAMLKPFTPMMPTVLLAPAPPAMRVRALGEDERLKVGAWTVSTIVVVLLIDPEAPVTVTV
jgi:hypothetical protein